MKKHCYVLLFCLLTLTAGASAQKPPSWMEQGVKDYGEKKYEQAAENFNSQVKATPRNAEAHFYLGSANYELKRYDEAIASLEEAIKLKPNYAEANYALGRIYYEREEYEKALPFVETAHQANGKWTEPMVLLGDNHRKLGNLKKAVVPYQRAIGFDDKNPQARLGLGLTYVELNNRIAARQQLQKLQLLDKTLADQLKSAIDK